MAGSANVSDQTPAEGAARVGYISRGIVYLVIGVMAVLAAWGSGGGTQGSTGALQTILGQPYGKVLVGLVALGLVCFAVWRFIQSFGDADRYGTDGKGIAIRTGFAGSGLLNLALAYVALSIAFPALVPGSSGGGGGGSGGGGGGGGSGGGGGGGSAQDITAWIMGMPYGRWIIAAAGIIVILIGIGMFYRAFKRTFERHLAIEGREGWMTKVAQAGLSARGITLLIIGGFVCIAAWQADASEARGLGGALQTLQQQSYGWILLGVVALGLVCFGGYCFIQAAYRRINA